MKLSYAIQESPDGLAQAFIIGEELIGSETVDMVLGDNIFHGHGLKKRLVKAVQNTEEGKGATVFGYYPKSYITKGKLGNTVGYSSLTFQV